MFNLKTYTYTSIQHRRVRLLSIVSWFHLHKFLWCHLSDSNTREVRPPGMMAARGIDLRYTDTDVYSLQRFPGLCRLKYYEYNLSITHSSHIIVLSRENRWMNTPNADLSQCLECR